MPPRHRGPRPGAVVGAAVVGAAVGAAVVSGPPPRRHGHHPPRRGPNVVVVNQAPPQQVVIPQVSVISCNWHHAWRLYPSCYLTPQRLTLFITVPLATYHTITGDIHRLIKQDGRGERVD